MASSTSRLRLLGTTDHRPRVQTSLQSKQGCGGPRHPVGMRGIKAPPLSQEPTVHEELRQQ